MKNGIKCVYMKNILVVVLLLIGSKLFSQSAPHEIHSPQTDFYASTLSATQIQAFSRRAVQKLQDFGAALQVVGNAEYSISMREKSKASALKLFVNDAVLLKNISFSAPENTISIQDYMTFLLQHPQKMVLQDIQMTYPFHNVSAQMYQATYQFSWTVEDKKYPFIATLLLKKTKKAFGTEQKEVWEILIGEMGVF